ncbi:MAG: hypothetical protein ACFB10_18975 [Salibacteraceae bacterium]
MQASIKFVLSYADEASHIAEALRSYLPRLHFEESILPADDLNPKVRFKKMLEEGQQLILILTSNYELDQKSSVEFEVIQSTAESLSSLPPLLIYDHAIPELLEMLPKEVSGLKWMDDPPEMAIQIFEQIHLNSVKVETHKNTNENGGQKHVEIKGSHGKYIEHIESKHGDIQIG